MHSKMTVGVNTHQNSMKYACDCFCIVTFFTSNLIETTYDHDSSHDPHMTIYDTKQFITLSCLSVIFLLFELVASASLANLSLLTLGLKVI